MANNYYTLPNSEMYENSPAVVNFQRHSIACSVSYVGISRNQMTQSLSAGHNYWLPYLVLLSNYP